MFILRNEYGVVLTLNILLHTYLHLYLYMFIYIFKHLSSLFIATCILVLQVCLHNSYMQWKWRIVECSIPFHISISNSCNGFTLLYITLTFPMVIYISVPLLHVQVSQWAWKKSWILYGSVDSSRAVGDDATYIRWSRYNTGMASRFHDMN